MKKFFKNIIYLLAIIVLLSLGLDKLYTYIHYNGAPRNIPDYIMSLSPKDTLDYAIFGSSRALHGLDPKLINAKTNKKGFNFGVPGSSVFEIKLSVQQILKKNITKNVYIQIDYIWNEFYSGGACTIDWLTFINEKEIWNEFNKIDLNHEYILYKKIPFYRYIKYDSKLGFREITMSALNRKIAGLEDNRGYVPLFRTLKDSNSTFTYHLKPEFNSHISDIITFCKKRGVNLYFFTAPIYNFQGNNEILNKNLENYKDFSNSIKNYKRYQDNTHLNKQGSILFTELFIDTYFK